MSCKPDKSTPDETLHWLSCRGGAEKQFLWRNGVWNTPGTNYGTKPSGMATLGWRYVRPVDVMTTDQS